MAFPGPTQLHNTAGIPFPIRRAGVCKRGLMFMHVTGAAHKRGCETIVLIRCIQCHVVDMTLDAPNDQLLNVSKPHSVVTGLLNDLSLGIRDDARSLPPRQRRRDNSFPGRRCLLLELKCCQLAKSAMTVRPSADRRTNIALSAKKVSPVMPFADDGKFCRPEPTVSIGRRDETAGWMDGYVCLT